MFSSAKQCSQRDSGVPAVYVISCFGRRQTRVDVLTLIDAVEALGFASSTVEAIAARFLEEASVSWSDVRAAGIAGRDVVRLRRHMAGEVSAAPVPAAAAALSPSPVGSCIGLRRVIVIVGSSRRY